MKGQEMGWNTYRRDGGATGSLDDMMARGEANSEVKGRTEVGGVARE